jgi:hypothetical protein
MFNSEKKMEKKDRYPSLQKKKKSDKKFIKNRKK